MISNNTKGSLLFSIQVEISDCVISNLLFLTLFCFKVLFEICNIINHDIITIFLMSVVHLLHGHAPLGAYRQRFNISGPIHCSCRVGHGILETRSHALHSCPRWKHPGLHSLLDTVLTLTKFVQTNAAFCVIVHPRLAWDPG
jgi:hypothetical protein